MNKEEEDAILVIASHILAYPGEDFEAEKKTIDMLMTEHIESNDIKVDLAKAYEALFRLSSQEIEELYVNTFDLKAKLGLYLTAHELGDSTKRGAALIKMQNIIQEAGFDRDEEELADYIPMLFEFLAVAPETSNNERLYRRIAVALQRMVNNIDKENPYAGILQFLMQYVFPHPTKEEVEQLEFNREEADLEELPYPIMYQ